MKKNLTELVREYKQSKSVQILNQIFLEAEKIIKDKAKYLFYKKEYLFDRVDVEVWDKETKQFKIVKKGRYLKLCDTKKLDLEDVEQELRLLLLQLIEKYDVTKNFETYFYATLWDYAPEVVEKRDLIKDLQVKNETEMRINDEDSSFFDNFACPEVKYNEEENPSEKFKKLTKIEKKVLNLLSKFPNKSQTELAKELGVTQPRISQIIQDLRDKYKLSL